MRPVCVAAAVLAACGSSSSDKCTNDTSCGSGQVCARDGECLAPADVWSLKVTWTVNGMPASATTCAHAPDLELDFEDFDLGDTFGYAPVPCAAGQFTIDKLPRRFDQVDLGTGGRYVSRPITGGVVAFDLSL
jgi:hypothetical protein